MTIKLSAALLGILAAGTLQARDGDSDAAPLLPQAVFAITGLEGSDVRQCGIRALARMESEALSVDLVLERSGARADFVVRAAGEQTATT